jgi:hypothetical protein
VIAPEIVIPSLIAGGIATYFSDEITDLFDWYNILRNLQTNINFYYFWYYKLENINNYNNIF